jgi:uroporphyrinogen decarboxylase
MGFTEFLIACTERIEFVKAIFDMATEWVIEVARKAVDIGADMIIDNADVAFKTGPFISPKLMEEIHVPCLKKVVDAVKSRRAYIFNHTHGNIWSLLDMLIGTGIDVIHPLAPEGLMDISKVKKMVGSRVVVAGNISTDLLSRASQDEVARVTRETIENTMADSGFILMASSSIHSAVNPENYKTMVETCHTHGRYDNH